MIQTALIAIGFAYQTGAILKGHVVPVHVSTLIFQPLMVLELLARQIVTVPVAK